MRISKAARVVYCLLGILYVLIGAGAMVLPIGWLPQKFTDDILIGETPSPFVDHLLQEFGTIVLALGLVFLWYATRKELSRSFHWAMTFYFFLNAVIHVVGPDGLREAQMALGS